jgi:23S rRNA (cytosine1962-C5)-methyltransferase
MSRETWRFKDSKLGSNAYDAMPGLISHTAYPLVCVRKDAAKKGSLARVISWVLGWCMMFFMSFEGTIHNIICQIDSLGFPRTFFMLISTQNMIIKPQPDYELLDSGEAMKLERYGEIMLARPDPQAIWPKRLDMKAWDNADATFIKAVLKRGGDGDDSDAKGKWHVRPASQTKFKPFERKDKSIQYAWPITLGSIRIFARLTPFKHTGIFPEQLANWQWMEEVFDKRKAAGNVAKPRILNLFGYSGGASIVCAKAGAEVTHVDASRAAIAWAKENMIESGLDEKAIRWILEDATLFVKRELRRGAKYDGIIMDPPVFGRGAKGEVWKIERDLQPLLEMCYKLLSDRPAFFILNGYASGYSSVAYANNLSGLVGKYGGKVEGGELLIEESDASKTAPRYLPCGIVARWRA